MPNVTLIYDASYNFHAEFHRTELNLIFGELRTIFKQKNYSIDQAGHVLTGVNGESRRSNGRANWHSTYIINYDLNDTISL
jgi:hypothetical protein